MTAGIRVQANTPQIETQVLCGVIEAILSKSG